MAEDGMGQTHRPPPRPGPTGIASPEEAHRDPRHPPGAPAGPRLRRAPSSAHLRGPAGAQDKSGPALGAYPVRTATLVRDVRGEQVPDGMRGPALGGRVSDHRADAAGTQLHVSAPESVPEGGPRATEADCLRRWVSVWARQAEGMRSTARPLGRRPWPRNVVPLGRGLRGTPGGHRTNKKAVPRDVGCAHPRG